MMKKSIGVTLFMLGLYATLVGLLLSNPDADLRGVHLRMGERLGLNGMLALAAGILIISGGIDLSIGSQVGLYAVVFAMMTVDSGWSKPVALGAILALAAGIGAFHGILVAKLKLQPFMVTLCGLFIYRSLARVLSGGRSISDIGKVMSDLTVFFVQGSFFGVSYYLIVFLLVAGVAAVFLHFSVHGRYLYAIGSNEQAARYAGIATDRYRIGAYMICSILTALFTFFFLTKGTSVEPSQTGINDELRAIASAVLGGCTLRGGEGAIYGMAVGTLILVIINQLTGSFWEISDSLEGIMIGLILLAGITVDELLRRRRRH